MCARSVSENVALLSIKIVSITWKPFFAIVGTHLAVSFDKGNDILGFKLQWFGFKADIHKLRENNERHAKMKLKLALPFAVGRFPNPNR